MSSPAAPETPPCPSCGLPVAHVRTVFVPDGKGPNHMAEAGIVLAPGEHVTEQVRSDRPEYDFGTMVTLTGRCPEWEESEKQFLRPINPDPVTTQARGWKNAVRVDAGDRVVFTLRPGQDPTLEVEKPR